MLICSKEKLGVMFLGAFCLLKLVIYIWFDVHAVYA